MNEIDLKTKIKIMKKMQSNTINDEYDTGFLMVLNIVLDC